MAKYIFVTGGVISGTGKGIGAASIGLLLKLRGHTVSIIKFDPYLNVNAGILAPREHGECFLCDDGTETDLDLGHYERIAGTTVSHKNICTSGTLYKELIQEQEDGKYLGETIQIIPHLTGKIHDRLTDLGKDSEIVIAEIGGCVGDIESGAFYEAIRQFKQKYDDTIVVMVAPILWVPTIKEFKTKPLQRSVKDLQSFGIQPDIMLCRVDREPPKGILDKVSNMTSVPRECCFIAPDVDTIYKVPIEFYDREIDDLVADKLHLKRNGCRIGQYRKLVEKASNPELPVVNIGIFGKYDNCDEAYISLKEALMHAGVASDVRTNIKWVNAEDLEGIKSVKSFDAYFEGLDAIVVPGGFDSRGVEGKIRAIQYAREKNVPFLGLCLGLQCAIIEFARNVCGLKDANSFEFSKKSPHPVISFVEGQKELTKKSGTMRLGAYDCNLKENSLARSVYKTATCNERHRHRYEVNEKYVEMLEENKMIISGRHPKSNLVEIIEIKEHPYFIATQAHPEFKSRLVSGHPLFIGLIAAAKFSQKTSK
jgi:CTP synthase